MSKDIIIERSGVPVALSGVERLRVPELGHGSAYWVPEDECTTGALEVTANGVYVARDSDLYAFSRVSVAVPEGSQAVGNGQDGKFYKVTVGEDDELVYTEVPKTMAVTTPPEITVYRVKDLIDYTGLVVTMYGGDGAVFTDDAYPTGVIPMSEILRPTQTVKAGMTEVEVYWLCPQSGLLMTAAFDITILGGE